MRFKERSTKSKESVCANVTVRPKAIKIIIKRVF